MNDEINEHAEIIRNTVFHSYPFKRFGLNPDEPHAEDCEGCLINAEVDKLVEKLRALSRVEKIIEDLDHVKEERNKLKVEQFHALRIAGIPEDEDRSIEDIVQSLVNERDNLKKLLQEVRNGLDMLGQHIRE